LGKNGKIATALWAPPAAGGGPLVIIPISCFSYFKVTTYNFMLGNS